MSIATTSVIVSTQIDSPLGPLVAAATDDGICRLEFAEPTADRVRWPDTHPHLERLRTQLSAYFAGTLRAFTVPLAQAGTPFQARVWAALARIPYGETCSYEDIAKALGDAKAVRAVGTANGRNRIAIVVPCHRVINKGGALGGYGGGLDRKQFLLELEASHPERAARRAGI